MVKMSITKVKSVELLMLAVSFLFYFGGGDPHRHPLEWFGGIFLGVAVGIPLRRYLEP